LFSPFHTDAALKRIEKNKKCDEQVKIRDEQARGAKMEGKVSPSNTAETAVATPTIRALRVL
jgi:hypothetical protein